MIPILGIEPVQEFDRLPPARLLLCHVRSRLRRAIQRPRRSQDGRFALGDRQRAVLGLALHLSNVSGELVARQRLLGEKDIAIRPRGGRDGDPTEEVSVDPAWAGVHCLGDAELAALDDLATRCDDVYGDHDHDIEFAFRGGEIFLLQRRPITRA